MTRPYFLIKENPTSANPGSFSFSEDVQWVSCNRMTRASCFTARWQRTFILLAVRPSMFSCKNIDPDGRCFLLARVVSKSTLAACMSDRNKIWQTGSVSTHLDDQSGPANRQTSFSGRGNACESNLPCELTSSTRSESPPFYNIR